MRPSPWGTWPTWWGATRPEGPCRRSQRARIAIGLTLLGLCTAPGPASAQFTLRDSSRADVSSQFTITTFATGLNGPLGVVTLKDSSILAANILSATGLNWPLRMVLLEDGSILVSIVEGTCLDRLDVRRRADGSQQVHRRSGHRSNRWELPPRRHRRANRTGSPPTTGACAWEAQFFLEEFDGDCEEWQDLPLIRVCQPCIINLV